VKGLEIEPRVIADILYIAVVALSAMTFLLGLLIGQYLGRRSILKKLQKSGKIDASTLALLEEY